MARRTIVLYVRRSSTSSCWRFGIFSRFCSIHLLRNARILLSMLFILTRKIGIKNRIYTHNVFVHYETERVHAMTTTTKLFIFACVFGQIAIHFIWIMSFTRLFFWWRWRLYCRRNASEEKQVSCIGEIFAKLNLHLSRSQKTTDTYGFCFTYLVAMRWIKIGTIGFHLVECKFAGKISFAGADHI